MLARFHTAPDTDVRAWIDDIALRRAADQDGGAHACSGTGDGHVPVPDGALTRATAVNDIYESHNRRVLAALVASR